MFLDNVDPLQSSTIVHTSMASNKNVGIGPNEIQKFKKQKSYLYNIKFLFNLLLNSKIFKPFQYNLSPIIFRIFHQ